MSLLKHLPNALTVCNLLCGCLGIIVAGGTTFEPYLVAYFVWVACIFDFLDGFAARLLKVSSPIGKELDSLADMVTFGVLPSLFMLNFLMPFAESAGLPKLSFIALTIVVCSALRLAKFNVDTRQAEGFIGVPTPANTLFFISLPALYEYFGIQPEPYSLIGIILLFSWLMVSPLRLFALKFKSFGWKGNELKFTFLILSGLLIVVLKEAAVSIIIILYILVSLFAGWRREGTESTKPSH